MEHNQTERDVVAYILARTDLPSMNSGKMAAQVHHAGVQMVAKYSNRDLVQEYIRIGNENGAVYFNTTLVLGATYSDIDQCTQLANNLPVDDVVFNTVVDPSYPFFVESKEIANLIPTTSTTKQVSCLSDGKVLMVREELTCAWFLGSRTNPNFSSMFSQLKLHP